MKMQTDQDLLKQDQQRVESIIEKDHLNRFNLTNTDAPFNYFESFPERLMARIQTEKKNQIKPSLFKMFFLQPYGKIAVAAAFILIVAGTYLFSSANKAKVETVSIQEISIDEMKNYVNNNEAIAELDYDYVIKKENASLEKLGETEIKEIQKAIIQ
jgi:hypothetical protein